MIIAFIIHNLAVSSEKVISSESRTKYAQIKNFLPEISKTNTLVDFDENGQHGIDFFTAGNIIVDYGLVFKSESDSLKLTF